MLVSRLAPRVPLMMGGQQPVRNMATIQQLKLRVKSVVNVQKITSAMNMVAKCKLRSAQDNLAVCRGFSRDLTEIYSKAEPKQVNTLGMIAISSDRGLCGAINSSIGRAVRDRLLQAKSEGQDYQIVLIGEKGKQALERLFKNQFVVSISESGKLKRATFRQASEVADMYLGLNVDKFTLFYQRFVSMVSYVTTDFNFAPYAAVKEQVDTDMVEYEMEGNPDLLQNLYEFRGAVILNHFMAENETSTLSSRMSAMDNSSKNAADMIEKLQLIINRSRQAKITTELTEIISGAAAVSEA